ncbi:hypothetical protein GGQ80_002975 [Sphingomonas jinjuensis]|uniref:Uncharacterized protein n=1 Tax=Sphingomonas jinjuensis TaxID=535907 RepID=A0A840FMA2_9SPHN|nr:hypothetical protein [Sphingomonas jinjuensis]MBB4155058.1 hypothetical protein [Sphingomonas jinjuensis]
MPVDPVSFEGLFNMVHAHIGQASYAAGRTAMKDNNFDAPGELARGPLRALQFAVAYLVNEGELDHSFNERADAVTSTQDAHALLSEINREARGHVLGTR